MMTHIPQYKAINIHSPLNEPIYYAVKKLHNTNFMTTMEMASKLNIPKNTSRYAALTTVLNKIVYEEKEMVRQTIPATKDSPSYKEFPQYIIDYINDNAKKNELTYQQQVRQDLIKLYENYVIETTLTDIEIKKVEALMSIWGDSKEDATTKVLAEREPIVEKPKKHTSPGNSIITDEMMFEYLPSLRKPKSTKQILAEMQQKMEELNRQIQKLKEVA